MRTAPKLLLSLLPHRDQTIRLEVALRGPARAQARSPSKGIKIRYNKETTLKTFRITVLQRKQSNILFIWILLLVLSEGFLKILRFNLNNQTLLLNKFKIIPPKSLRSLTTTSNQNINRDLGEISKKNNTLYQLI